MRFGEDSCVRIFYLYFREIKRLFPIVLNVSTKIYFNCYNFKYIILFLYEIKNKILNIKNLCIKYKNTFYLFKIISA